MLLYTHFVHNQITLVMYKVDLGNTHFALINVSGTYKQEHALQPSLCILLKSTQVVG